MGTRRPFKGTRAKRGRGNDKGMGNTTTLFANGKPTIISTLEVLIPYTM
jgi:hypothetical protein